MYDTRGLRRVLSLKMWSYPNYNGDIRGDGTGCDTQVFSFALEDKGLGSYLISSACHI